MLVTGYEIFVLQQDINLTSKYVSQFREKKKRKRNVAFMLKIPLMITLLFGSVLQLTKDMPVAKKNNCSEALNVSHECYGKNKLKRKGVMRTKLVDFEVITKSDNINIKL